jgi:hypothetical protein
MLDKFIESLSDEQKQALIDSLSDQLVNREPVENPERKNPQELMNEYNDSLKSEPQKKPRSVKVTKSKLRDQDLDFTINRTDNEVKTRMPVTETKRFNSFTDNGTEAKGEEFKTPDIEPTERRRPAVKKVVQKCSKCERSVEVHPTHARDWFTCDKCIGAR